MSEPKVMLPKFTDTVNRLVELHDKLFPNTKYISPEDAAFISRVVSKGNVDGVNLALDGELETLKDRVQKLEDTLNSVVAESHSWVIMESTASTVKPIHDKYRQIAKRGLEE